MAEKKIDPESQVMAKSTKHYKLKDKAGRHYVQFDIKELFGFVPKTMRVTKVPGKTNTFFISAIIPEKKNGK